MRFVNKDIHPLIGKTFHALVLDEKRRPDLANLNLSASIYRKETDSKNPVLTKAELKAKKKVTN